MKIVLLDERCLPYRKHRNDAGFDLKVREGFAIPPHSTLVVPSGIMIELEKGTQADITPRSSIFKRGVTISGKIDSDYRGEVGIMAHNMTNNTKIFEKYERIAQMVISRYEYNTILEVVDTLSDTERGMGGFGSTNG